MEPRLIDQSYADYVLDMYVMYVLGFPIFLMEKTRRIWLRTILFLIAFPWYAVVVLITSPIFIILFIVWIYDVVVLSDLRKTHDGNR